MTTPSIIDYHLLYFMIGIYKNKFRQSLFNNTDIEKLVKCSDLEFRIRTKYSIQFSVDIERSFSLYLQRHFTFLWIFSCLTSLFKGSNVRRKRESFSVSLSLSLSLSHTHTHRHTRARTGAYEHAHARAHSLTHSLTHTHTQTHTHTHTHTKYRYRHKKWMDSREE